jgi:hypothetical protein
VKKVFSAIVEVIPCNKNDRKSPSSGTGELFWNFPNLSIISQKDVKLDPYTLSNNILTTKRKQITGEK